MSAWMYICVVSTDSWPSQSAMTVRSTPFCSSCIAALCRLCRPRHKRHTSAMIILQATQDIRKVSLWLGHANLATTEIYTRGDPTEKLEAIESIVPPHLRKGVFRPPDKLIALLRDTAVMETKMVHEQHR